MKTREGDVLLQVCNNAKCRRREERPFQFERCSQCQAAFYCGPMCQEEDWFVGHHWRRCKAPKSNIQTSTRHLAGEYKPAVFILFLQILKSKCLLPQKLGIQTRPETCEFVREIVGRQLPSNSFAGLLTPRLLAATMAKFWFVAEQQRCGATLAMCNQQIRPIWIIRDSQIGQSLQRCAAPPRLPFSSPHWPSDQVAGQEP